MSIRIDDILADSFPASDPPSWTLGYVDASLVRGEEEAEVQEKNDRPQPESSDSPQES